MTLHFNVSEESLPLIQISSKMKNNQSRFPNLRAAALNKSSYELHQVVQLSYGLRQPVQPVIAGVENS